MFPNWGFRNTVHAYHAPKTVKLPVKTDSAERESDTALIPYSELVKHITPQVAPGARSWLNPLLFNGVLQALYGGNSDYSKVYQVHYARQILDIDETTSKKYAHLYPGQFTADYVVEPREKTREGFQARYNETLPEGYPRLFPRTRYYTESELDDVYSVWDANDKPIVVIQHGLAGGSHEAAIRAVADKLFTDGCNIVVLNSRGCCRSKLTTPLLFTGLHTDELRFFVDLLRKRFPKKQIHLTGFSFGGVVIANYLAEEKENSVVTSAITVSSPWDLYDSAYECTRTWSGRKFFAPAIRYFMMNLIKNNRKVLAEDPELFNEEEFDAFNKTAKYSMDYDDKYTARMAGFPSNFSYYIAASPMVRVMNIKTPMLILNSLDDPLISHHYPYTEAQKNPYLYMATCDLGGHYNFIDCRGEFWFADVIRDFVSGFHDKVDHSRRNDDGGYEVKQTGFREKLTLY